MVDGREADLIRQALMGIESAFQELIDPLVPQASRLAYGLLQQRDLAEDGVWEAATLAWRRLETFDRSRSFRPWFLGIVANRCRETRRGRWWRRAVPWSDTDDPDPPFEDRCLTGLDLRRAIAGLPHRNRVAIVLHFYLDLPLEEVAVTLGLSISGVKSRINRGLHQLRRDMNSEVKTK